MIEDIAAKVLGMLIGFLLGAIYMAWMGSDPARSLFFWKRKQPEIPGEIPKMKDHSGGHYSRPVDFDSPDCPICYGRGIVPTLSGSDPCPCREDKVASDSQKLVDRVKDTGMNYRTGDPDCPICHGEGHVHSLSAPVGSSVVPCSCKLLRDLDADDIVKLTIEQSLEVAAWIRAEDPEPYVTVHVEDIVRPKIKAMLEKKGVETIPVMARNAAYLTGQTFKLPEADPHAVYHEEGDPHLRDEFGHLLEGRGPTTVKTYGPKTGRLSCSGSNFNPRDDEITEHEPAPGACLICKGSGSIWGGDREQPCVCAQVDSGLKFPEDLDTDEFGTIKNTEPDEPDGKAEMPEAIKKLQSEFPNTVLQVPYGMDKPDGEDEAERARRT